MLNYKKQHNKGIYMIKQITNNNLKQEIVNTILRNLPEWFEIESAIADYTKNSVNTTVFAHFENNVPVGVISLKHVNNHTLEVYVMGVEKHKQKLGIGTKLIDVATNFAKQNNYKLLQVKTLDESFVPYDKFYEITRKFYNKVGFYNLECLNIWGNNNPCIIMVKPIN